MIDSDILPLIFESTAPCPWTPTPLDIYKALTTPVRPTDYRL